MIFRKLENTEIVFFRPKKTIHENCTVVVSWVNLGEVFGRQNEAQLGRNCEKQAKIVEVLIIDTLNHFSWHKFAIYSKIVLLY